MDSHKNFLNRVSHNYKFNNWKNSVSSNVYDYESVLNGQDNSPAHSIKLFINWYNEKDEERSKEYNECVSRNVSNEYISKIYVLTNVRITKELKEKFNDKTEFIKIKSNKPTFNEIFNIVNENVEIDDISIITNLDIFFDKSIKLANRVGNNECYALTRYDITKIENDNIDSVYHNRADSQDVWIFRGKIKEVNADFQMGKRGCDNRLAYELMQSGYILTNPSINSIKCYHLHLTNKRNYDKHSNDDLIPKPYYFVKGIVMEKIDNNDQVNIIKEIRSDNKKVIMHFGLNLQNQTRIIEALKNMGDNYIGFNWRDFLNKNGCKNTRNRMIELVGYYKPDFLFMQIQRSGIIDYALIDIFSKLVPNIKIMNWTGDVREPIPQWFFDVGKHKNVYTAFSNETHAIELCKSGINAHFVQIGYEHNIFNRNGSVRDYIKPIVFFGNHYKERFPLSRFRLNMVNLLFRRYKDKFQLYGTGWPSKFKAINLMGKNDKVAEVLRSCKIVIGISHFNLSRYGSGRLFTTMGTGAFYLCNKYENCEIDFQDKKHLVYWKDFTELCSYIDYYLVHSTERKEIAKNGNIEIETKHRWINRIEDIKRIIEW